jgi:uridylate kinase
MRPGFSGKSPLTPAAHCPAPMTVVSGVGRRNLMPSSPPAAPRFRRVLLKVSGEALMGAGQYGIDYETVERIADELKDAKELGVEISLVVGGGNIFRGMQQAARGMERASADYMGMLATVMNAIALQNALERIGLYTRVLSAIEMTAICEPYIRRRAIRHMEKGRIVIFAAGTGNPFFTTDTAAALRAAEMGCDALFKGTNVDGVYTADPKKDKSATRLERLTYHEVMVRDLKVMDQAAIALTRENKIPIIVFSIAERGGIVGALTGAGKSTTIIDD